MSSQQWHALEANAAIEALQADPLRGLSTPEADARLIELHSLHCDEASLTSESMPVTKALAPVREDAPVADRRNMVFTGTIVTFGRSKAVVCATGMHTEFGKIAQEAATAVTEKTPLERRTDEIGRWLGLITLSICVLVVGVSVARESLAGTFTLTAMLPMVMFAIALAVAAVPEALAAIVTGALAIAMHDMAKRNALVRRMPTVETLGCVSVICTDKTGTLTRGEMTVRRLYSDGRLFDVSGRGYTPEGVIEGAAGNAGVQWMLQAGLLVNDATLAEDAAGRWFVKGDSTEGALLVLASKGGVHAAQTRMGCERIEEFPFSSERKRMTTVHVMPDGQRMAFMKGAPEVVLERCVSHDSGGANVALDAAARERLHAVSESMAADALRVLGIAYKVLAREDPYVDDEVESEVESGMVFLGYAGMMDPPRAEAAQAVQVCRQVGIQPVMITGDHKLTAMAVAREIGIFRDGDLVLDGVTLAALAVLIECPIFLWLFFHHIDDMETARTQVFLLFVIVELTLAMSFRSLRYSIFEAPPHRWLVIAIFWEVVLISVLMQFDAVRAAFGIRMSLWTEVSVLLLLALGIMVSMELAKWALRRRNAMALRL